MKNNRINILAKLGSLVGLGALAIAPIAMIGTLSETQVIDSNIATEVQDDAVSVTSVNSDNGVGGTFLNDEGTLLYTISSEDGEAKTGTVSVSQGSILPSSMLNIPSAVENGDFTYTVTSIGDSAFEYCTEITNVTIPEGTTSIGSSAFFYCSGLIGELIIPNSVISIGSSAFSGCNWLTSVVIGAGVKTIGDNSFSDCLRLTGKLVIPNSVTSIEFYAFSSCSGLTDVIIPNSVKSIGNGAFSSCSGLTSVVIGSGVKTIGEMAFAGCTGLTSVAIPDSVTSIGNQAFSGCPLTSISLDKLNENFSMAINVGDAADVLLEGTDGILNESCSNVVSSLACGHLVIPDSVTSIGGSAFSDCSGLTSVIIGAGVKTIGSQAFQSCTGLTGELVIPNSVTSIGGSAFSDCSGLPSVTMVSAKPPTLGNNAFKATSSNFKIFVPAESVMAYKAALVWKDYVKIIFAIPDPIVPDPETPTNNNLGIIIGASVGGVVVLTAAIAGTIIGVKKHNKNKK